MNRRDFLKAAAAAGLASAMGSASDAAAGIPRRPLGKTGERLSIVGFGGIVVCGLEQDKADAAVQKAIERGVNYFDVAPSYGNGEAEEKLGAALQGYRDKVFLACKTGRRDAAGSKSELETSLKRLRTDHVDVYQLHGLTSVDDLDRALAKGGAIETLAQARKEGKTRFIGFSAHSAEAALAAMERFDFDTVLFPVNWVCYLQGGFGPAVVEAARKKNMGILALKAMARSPWAKDEKHTYSKCWYKPEPDPVLAALALRFALSEPITAALPPGHDDLFELAIKTAGAFKALTKDEREKLKLASQGVEPIFKVQS